MASCFSSLTVRRVRGCVTQGPAIGPEGAAGVRRPFEHLGHSCSVMVLGLPGYALTDRKAEPGKGALSWGHSTALFSCWGFCIRGLWSSWSTSWRLPGWVGWAVSSWEQLPLRVHQAWISLHGRLVFSQCLDELGAPSRRAHKGEVPFPCGLR